MIKEVEILSWLRQKTSSLKLTQSKSSRKTVHFSSAQGWYAVYKQENQYYFNRPIVTWKITCSNDNEDIQIEGLVFPNNDSNKLKEASKLLGFVGFKFVHSQPIDYGSAIRKDFKDKAFRHNSS